MKKRAELQQLAKLLEIKSLVAQAKLREAVQTENQQLEEITKIDQFRSRQSEVEDEWSTREVLLSEAATVAWRAWTQRERSLANQTLAQLKVLSHTERRQAVKAIGRHAIAEALAKRLPK